MEPLQGLHLNRSSSPTEPIPRLAAPSVCIIAQGSKEVSLGEACYRYDPGHYLITTAELPIVGQVVEASKERPYLSLRLDLDPVIVGSVIGCIALVLRRHERHPCGTVLLWTADADAVRNDLRASVTDRRGALDVVPIALLLVCRRRHSFTGLAAYPVTLSLSLNRAGQVTTDGPVPRIASDGRPEGRAA